MSLEGKILHETSALLCWKNFNSKKKADVEKFQGSLKDLIKGYNRRTVSINISSYVCVGHDFMTIEKVKRLNSDEEVNVEHK